AIDNRISQIFARLFHTSLGTLRELFTGKKALSKLELLKIPFLHLSQSKDKTAKTRESHLRIIA
ncbi:hypothetical protein, partial [Bartonella sp. AP36NXGY]|uniref:hypothetical protein n=1 Tax=Bartonella sp. AP36NXGY TaxID=3243493 RepID=UPI0035CF5DB3